MGRGPVVDVKQLQLCNCDDHDRLVQTGLHLATSNARICSTQGASCTKQGVSLNPNTNYLLDG